METKANNFLARKVNMILLVITAGGSRLITRFSFFWSENELQRQYTAFIYIHWTALSPGQFALSQRAEEVWNRARMWRHIRTPRGRLGTRLHTGKNFLRFVAFWAGKGCLIKRSSPSCTEYLTIIPRARVGSESIAHETEGRMGYWLRGHEGKRNNCFSKVQLVGKKYRDKATLAS